MCPGTDSYKRKNPQPRKSGWGSVLDIEIYLNVTEPMHPAQGRERIYICFGIRLDNQESSERLKIT